MGDQQLFIDDKIATWISKQKMFFVATAPLSEDGHINCSPKGLDTFRILDKHTVLYQDLTGSGAETIAHINENGRIIIMFCAFEGAPTIVRLYGKGQVILPDNTLWNSCHQLFEPRKGVRAYIQININKVTQACGYAVPEFEFKKNRKVLDDWFDRKGEDGLQAYRNEHNQKSIDGLDAILPL